MKKKHAVPMTRLVKHIQEYNDFLLRASGESKEEVQECVEELNILNASKQYEDFMKNTKEEKIMFGEDELTRKVKNVIKPATRYAHPIWWIAHAVRYNEITLERIQNGSFNPYTQMGKIHANATAVGEPHYGKLKRQLVAKWEEYCYHKHLNHNLFDDASQYGVDETN